MEMAVGTVIGGAFVGGLLIGFVICAIMFEKGWLMPWYVWRSKLGPHSRG
jgi:uncharacterized membrane protein YciS (DUF1049 family)